MQELTVEGLLTVAGNGAFVLLVLQLLVKPWLKPDEGDDSPAAKRYPAYMNLAAVAVGLIGAVAAQAVIGFEYAGVLQAILVGLGGAAVAIGSYELGDNLSRALGTLRR